MELQRNGECKTVVVSKLDGTLLLITPEVKLFLSYFILLP